uniref:Uncharacterized protein n=1 Tax=Arundo donax TaxID=35708 RepID=A0A0A9EZS9_ARUDO
MFTTPFSLAAPREPAATKSS